MQCYFLFHYSTVVYICNPRCAQQCYCGAVSKFPEPCSVAAAARVHEEMHNTRHVAPHKVVIVSSLQSVGERAKFKLQWKSLRREEVIQPHAESEAASRRKVCTIVHCAVLLTSNAQKRCTRHPSTSCARPRYISCHAHFHCSEGSAMELADLYCTAHCYKLRRLARCWHLQVPSRH
jgi:hypothetical protein